MALGPGPRRTERGRAGSRRLRVVASLALVGAGALGACSSGPKNFDNENDDLRREREHLKDRVSMLEAEVSEAQAKIDALDIVEHTCAISIFKAETAKRGMLDLALRRPKAYFIAFEPEPFFAMTNLYWGRGDEAYAKRRLEQGGAVIASLGSMRAPPEVKIGDTVTVSVEVVELMPEKNRARLACECRVGDTVVLDGEALVKVPTRGDVDDD